LSDADALCVTSTYPAAAPICLYRLCFDALANNRQTPSARRARLRSVSTNADDKLVSCLELSYHNIHIHMRPPTQASEDDVQVSTNYNDYRLIVIEDTGIIAGIAHGVGELGQQKRKGEKEKATPFSNADRKGKAVHETQGGVASPRPRRRKPPSVSKMDSMEDHCAIAELVGLAPALGLCGDRG